MKLRKRTASRIPPLLFALVMSTVFTEYVCLQCQSASAQLDALPRVEPVVETIDTNSLNALLGERRRQTEQAETSGKAVAPADFVVVDVRSQEEVQVSLIPGAITKAMYEKTPDEYRGRLVIPYCAVGGRSGAYARRLAKSGLRVKNYSGSIVKWVAAGLPLVTLKGESTNRVYNYGGRDTVPAQYEQVPK